jgi:manganese/iron transport system substrate-binding protein
MKKIIVVIYSLAAILALAACQPGAAQTQPAASSSGLKVMAAESFIADIAQNVAGDRLTVDTLMPLGIDPHGYEPAPQDVARIAESNVLIVNGAGFEEWLNEVIQNAGGEHTVIEAAQGLQSRTAREGEEAEMSPEEKADEFCTALSGVESAAKDAAPDAGAAAAAHEAEHQAHAGEAETEEAAHDHSAAMSLFQLTLVDQGDRQYGGFFTLHPLADGDYQIGAPEGQLVLSSLDGQQTYAPEDVLAVDCNGITQVAVYELEPGEYTLELSGFAAQDIPLAAGAAGGHHHHEGDPHFWLDPLSVVHYVENIRDGLIAADPDGKDVYTRNAEDYIAQLQDLDQWIREQVSTIPEERRLIVTNHESFGYFADRYGFTIIGTIVPSVSTNASPSAQQLARLIDRIRQAKAIAIFLETGTNPQLAQQVSADTGIPVVMDLYTHSISDPGGDAPTYIDMMKFDVRQIVNALK